MTSTASVSSLLPFIIGARIARPVSCYALFKWWLLLSQHPGCHSNSTSLVTKFDFGTLADGLGCFPLDREAYPSRTDSRDSRNGIRSLVQQGSLGRTLKPIQYLYPRCVVAQG